jgi:Concanavalin A-like lectin/glucanases superfamily/Domain of unknown function (DUF2341)/Carbohydrate esterase, sialic acid-specific acetylesterase
MKLFHTMTVTASLTFLSPTAWAQYPDWKETGAIFLNTTPDGANLPVDVSIEDFPLLVRLHEDFFDFASAAPSGEDVRFSSQGKALAYQIERWDAAAGTASIWVRIPKIQGNTRQEINLHWGKPTAKSESNGRAVFNESNGYLSVLHMGEDIIDEVGSVETKDVETTAVGGMIGPARHLAGQQGVSCGEENTNFPVGASSHSTEAWMRVEQSNGRALAWGNEHGQGKVVMQIMSPPHARMDCYFSGANVESVGRLPMNEWIHIAHTYEQGASRIYVNGELNNSSETLDAPLAIKTPSRFYIGGWYNHYDFVGDIDEVRISKVVRSPHWLKLQYENQKAMQTLVGPVVQKTGNTLFSVSPASATVLESEQATFTAQAAGAQKIYWILKSDEQEKILSVDRSAFTFAAGRVTGNKSVTLQCKAVFADGVRTKEIAISVKEDVQEPIFTLNAPGSWDGRTTIEVVPQVSNLEAMQSKNAGELQTQWNAGPFAVVKEIAPGKLLLKRSQNSGKLTVTATISNGGQPVSQSIEMAVTEPKSDPWVLRLPAQDEKPEEGQFYARDDNNEGTLHYNGTLTDAADSVFLKLYADDQRVHTANAKPAADKSYALSVKLKPGLIKYKVEFGTGTDNVLDTVGNLVCGDAYIIDGQSNALATDTNEQSPPETNQWIRSYARPSQNPNENVGNLWVLPVWKSQQGEKAELGWWGMELAKRLVESQQMPIFIINAAVGGTRIDMHQRNPADPTDLTSIYGRMLWRVERAKLTHGIRGILWHQGENDQGADGPTGGYGWETYHQYFIDMAAGWKQDFPNVQHYYVFQIWPNSCAMGGRFGSGDRLREQQRTLPQLFSNMSIMSTLGVRPPGGCHYPLEGWAEFARTIQPLIERDHYGKVPAGPISAANLRSASLNSARDTVVLEFDQPIAWDDKLVGQFYLDGESGKVDSGSAAGAVLTLRLKGPCSATKITYLKEIDWNQETLLLGSNGIAALTFCDVPLEASQELQSIPLEN